MLRLTTRCFDHPKGNFWEAYINDEEFIAVMTGVRDNGKNNYFVSANGWLHVVPRERLYLELLNVYASENDLPSFQEGEWENEFFGYDFSKKMQCPEEFIDKLI